VGNAEGPTLDVEQAARLAAEAEQALKELEPAKERAPHVRLPKQGLPPGIEDKLFGEWADRLAEMEKKVAGPHEVSAEDVDELQAVAQEVVDYKQRLHEACGYRNKDLKEDKRLHLLEDRLDALAATILPEFTSPRPAPEAEAAPAGGAVAASACELKKRAQQLAAKMVHAHEEVVGLSPSEAKEVEQLLLEVADLKADMTKEGLHEHEQYADRDERVLKRMVRVSEIRQKEHHDKKHDQHRHRAKHGEELRAELKQLEHGLGAHKQRLRDELGYSHKDLKHDPEVAELEERLSALHKFGGA